MTADEMKTKVVEFENRWETLNSMTKVQQPAERAKEHEKEQRATAIVARILKVLADENLSLRDAHRILAATIDTAIALPTLELKRTTKITAPENLEEAIKWGSRLMPEFE